MNSRLKGGKYPDITSGKTNKWCQSHLSSKMQDLFYRDLLDNYIENSYEPEEGEIVEIFKIPCKLKENTGLECNKNNPSMSKQSALNMPRSESQYPKPHQRQKKTCQISSNSDKNSLSKNITTMDNSQKWLITHCPTKEHYLM